MLAINGGQPVRTVKWPTYEDGTKICTKEVKKYVNNVLDSGRLFRYDTRPISKTMTGDFENKLKKFYNCNYALAVSSGTAALTLALMSLNLPKGFSVACPTFGFPATASAVLLAGGIPKLFASDQDLYYDMDDMQIRWDNNIKVIIVVHMRGYAQPIEKIVEFAREKGVYVIEDAVPAMGAKANGKLLGTFGDIGCFSTQSDKTIVTGEGGFIITNNSIFFERAILLSGAFESRINKHELVKIQESECSTPLYSFRMDEVRAAIAIPQLENIYNKIFKLQTNHDYIIQEISNINNIRLRKKAYSDGYLGDSLIFFVDGFSASLVAKALTAEGIIARSFGDDGNARSFEQWMFIEEVREREFHEIASIKNTKLYLKSTIDIPLSFLLSMDDLDDAITAIKKVMANIYKIKEGI